MYCQKCGKKLPEDSLFCTGCGCRLNSVNEPAEKPAVYENQPAAPEYVPAQVPVPAYTAAPMQIPENGAKRDKKVIILLSLLIASLIACVVLLAITLNLQSKNSEYRSLAAENEIKLGQLERENSAKTEELDDLKEELAEVNEELDAVSEAGAEYADMALLLVELLEYIGSEDSWGYSTENFHANKGIMVIDRMSGEQTLRVFSTYYATFTFEIEDESVISAKWSDKEWTEKETQIYITPLDYGITTMTISNDLYDNAFDVLVIVI